MNKPRLVFFQWNHEKSPLFLQVHTQLHAKCLSGFFDVIVINKDCDYERICETYKPEVALFESGFKSSFSRKIKIKNTSCFPEIPKIGFHNGDSWCDCRPGFISDMEHWGIETFFTISTTTAEHTPEIAENLFVWPNFIDSDIYRDYGETKSIPILFNGSMISLYPWRQRIHEVVATHFPTVTLPHLGYSSHSPLMIYGEQYARKINASWFVPACGTIAKDVIRKHFEVPGCKACLVTENTPSVKAAGFLDMQNCIFADEKNVIDKLNYLFENRGVLNKVIDAGYNLVHSSHTLKQRNQIYQWFILNKELKSNEKIVQGNPFKPLYVVEKASGINNKPIRGMGSHLDLFQKGNNKLNDGKYEEAEEFYLKVLEYISSMCEPKLKLTMCNLYMGNVEKAFYWIIQPIQYNLGIYGAFDPDPVEWAYYIITLLCQGKLTEAIIRTYQFPSLSHLELYRTCFIVRYLQNNGDYNLIQEDRIINPRYSIHHNPQISFVDWVDNICRMLRACQRNEYVKILNDLVFQKPELTKTIKCRSFKCQLENKLLLARISCIKRLNNIFYKMNFPPGRRGLPSVCLYDYAFQVLKLIKFRSALLYHNQSFLTLYDRVKNFFEMSINISFRR